MNTSLGKKRSGGDDYCNIYCQQRKDEALQTLNGTVIIRVARTLPRGNQLGPWTLPGPKIGLK